MTTDRTPAEMRTDIDAANAEVNALCHGSRRWTMTVPAEPDRDSDLVIARALSDASALLAQLAEEQAKVERLEGEKATLVDAVQHAIDRGVGVGWELQPIVANLAEAAKAHNLAEQAKGAKALAEDIRAGVRHHVKECEAELRGQGYVCIHRIDSATATVVLRLAKLHRAALLASPVAPEEKK